MPQLIFYLDQDYPQVQDVLDEKISIGRTKDNDVALKDTRVSVFHAEISQKDNGSYLLNDLDSHNGTIVNGTKISDSVLKDGDQIMFGSIKALFVDTPKPKQDSSEEVSKIKDLKREADGLMRKSQIERNNLRLIEDDRKQINRAAQVALEKKDELEGEVARLEKEIKVAKADLEENRTSADKLDAVIKDANSFKANVKQLEDDFEKREKAFEELGNKIKDKEKAYEDLDLDGAIKKKEELVGEHDRLTKELADTRERLAKEIETAKAELAESKRESDEASVFIKKAKEIEAGIAGLETKLEKRKSDSEKLEHQISEQEKESGELGKKIAERNNALDKLNEALEGKRGEVDQLGDLVTKNSDLIRASAEKLEAMEVTFKQGRDNLIKAQDEQKTLKQESQTLSLLVKEKSAVLHRLKTKIDARKYGTEEPVCPPLRVVNPAMRSLIHYFHNGPGLPDQDRVDPIGYNAIAACSKGSMHREADSILAGEEAVLVLLTGDTETDRQLIATITAHHPGRILLVCWSSGQLGKITAGMNSDSISSHLGALLEGVSGVISADVETAKLLGEFDIGRPHLNIPLPCPIDYAEWNLSQPLSKRRRGIFVSGDGFDQNLSIHQSRLEVLNQLVEKTRLKVGLYQHEPAEIPGLNIPADLLTRVRTPLKYGEYLTAMGEYQFVTGFGANPAGGDVMGDAILTRSVYVGADSGNATDQILFPDSCIKNGEIENALKNASGLLSDPNVYSEVVDNSQHLAGQLISFETVSERLNEFLSFVAANPAGV